MNRKTVVIGLFADRIDVLLCMRDQVIASHRIECAFGSDADTWLTSIEGAGSKLGTVIEEMKAQDLPAYVLYRNPTASSDTTSMSIASASQARQAATLGCAESLSCPLDDAATAALVIGRDRTGDPPQSHVVVAADLDEAVAAIASMVSEAGLQFQSATPIDALLMAGATSNALSGSEANQGYLYIGEHRSFFVIADRGRLLFCRQIALGSDALIWSLTKPMRAATGGTPIELTLSDAREIIYTAGIPKRDQIVHEPLGLMGSQIIPMLQPVLQRFTVELRQSLRFGVPEDQRQTVILHVGGPGSAIPNLATVIGAELGLNIVMNERYSKFDCKDPASAGCEVHDAITNARHRKQLELRPRQMAAEHSINRLQRWLWAGTAGALVMIAAETWNSHSRLAAIKQEVAAIESQSTDQNALQATGEKLFKMIAAIDKLESNIGSECGVAINVRACMQEFSRVTPDAIRLINIAFSQDKGKTVGRLTGHAVDGASTAGRTHIEPFVEQLKASPLFDDVMLSNVQVGAVNGQEGHQFVITLTGVAVPRSPQPQAVASAPSGAVQ